MSTCVFLLFSHFTFYRISSSSLIYSQKKCLGKFKGELFQISPDFFFFFLPQFLCHQFCLSSLSLSPTIVTLSRYLSLLHLPLSSPILSVSISILIDRNFSQTSLKFSLQVYLVKFLVYSGSGDLGDFRAEFAVLKISCINFHIDKRHVST